VVSIFELILVDKTKHIQTISKRSNSIMNTICYSR
jgi:hypothetical protein